MGVYVYCTKPSHVATAVVEIDGVRSETEVALYRYAYKPTYAGWDAEKTNQRWRFRSGAAACASAYARSAKAVPSFGVFFDDEAAEVYAGGRGDANGAFLTNGEPEVWDDGVNTVGRVVRWVKLPKGISEGRMPLDMRLTETTVLEYQPTPQGTYWVRLADPAAGEVQPEWTLMRTIEDMYARAARFGVPIREDVKPGA